MTHTLGPGDGGQTLAAMLRKLLPGQSWSQVRAAVAARRIKLNGELALDPARRLKDGDAVEVLDQSQKLPQAFATELAVRYLDEHVVVVEKPTGISTVRHPEEQSWSQRRRRLDPTLEDLLHRSIAKRLGQPLRTLPRLRKVHRLDKLTSGLVAFARSAYAERLLGHQFKAHTVDRQYLAVVLGRARPGTIRSWLVRDRGDGRRGSWPAEGSGKLAITHLESVEPLGAYSLVTCRLETGRTHQIRIHLSEQGHLVCGDPVYIIRKDGTRFDDKSGAPRLALHAAVLGFTHPATGERLRWEMPPPPDMADFVAGLKR
ncbi:MAG: RluA family pseudouridine synthase [Gemmataceae bacterium]